VNTSAQKGQYGFRIEMSDFSGNTVRAPDSSVAGLGDGNGGAGDGGDGGGGGGGAGGGDGGEFIEFLVIDNQEQLVEAARADIASLINNHPTNLAAKFVRMAFHDCVGGCDG